jgi:hypothetical protein
MTTAALTATMPALHVQRTPEAKEGPGPDHDGDADDKSVAASTAGQTAAAPKGMGAAVDTQA